MYLIRLFALRAWPWIKNWEFWPNEWKEVDFSGWKLKKSVFQRRGKGMFKAFCKTSLFSCLKLHSLKPLLGLYSEDWRQTVGFRGVPLIAKQKTFYWENMYFCKQLTQQSPLSYSSAVLQCGNGIILQNFWCLIRDSCMKDPFPQEEH